MLCDWTVMMMMMRSINAAHHTCQASLFGVIGMSTILFIDFEAFQHGVGETYRIKELCVIDAARPMQPLYRLYKPPMPWAALNGAQKRTYNYQEKHLLM